MPDTAVWVSSGIRKPQSAETEVLLPQSGRSARGQPRSTDDDIRESPERQLSLKAVTHGARRERRLRPKPSRFDPRYST